MSSARVMFLAAIAAHVVLSNEPKTPGAGQHDAPSISFSSISSLSNITLVAFSIPGYLLFIIHPKKYANDIVIPPYSNSPFSQFQPIRSVSYTHLRAHETVL